MSVVYEVTAEVEAGLVDQWERYMRERHIPEILASGCFTAARLARADGGRYRILYEAAAEADLERYLGNHAPALRAEFLARFPAGVGLSREVWSVIQDWKAGRSSG